MYRESRPSRRTEMSPVELLESNLDRITSERQRVESELEYITESHDYAPNQGYDLGSKQGILFGDWNPFDEIRDVLDEIEKEWELEWSDEWTTCSNCNKAIRTSPDSYDWLMMAWDNEDGLYCMDCFEPQEYLESMENNPKKANHLFDPKDYGYVLLEEGYESGLHPHQTDNPTTIYKELRKNGEKRSILFSITGKGQFDIHFATYVKGIETEREEE
jgi:hypothetical protein